jgi:hypothetical protein
VKSTGIIPNFGKVTNCDSDFNMEKPKKKQPIKLLVKMITFMHKQDKGSATLAILKGDHAVLSLLIKIFV